MPTLKLSPDLKLPLEAVTQTFAVLAKRGVGKSYTADVLAEELLDAGQQVVILDPTGAHWGLRSSADGKSPGFPIVVFGGDRGDLPLEPHAGETVAEAVCAHRFSAILDFALLRKGQTNQFCTAFLETLYRKNRQPLHLVVDEADTFAPQRLFGDEARLCGAMEDVVKKGRIRGLGCTLITQRPAVLNKNVLTQCESLFAMRLTHPKDMDAIREWVAVHATPEEERKVVADLPTLPIGTGWFWSPGWLSVLKRVEIRAKTTFDSGATPKPGQRKITPKALATVNLDALGEQIKQAAAVAKSNDPKELKRQIVDLQQQLAKRPAAEEKTKVVEKPILGGKDIDRLEKVAHSTQKQLDLLGEALGKIQASLIKVSQSNCPPPPKPETRIKNAPNNTLPRRPPADGAVGGDLGAGGLRRMMSALAQRPGLSSKQLGLRAGLSSSSGTFGTYLARGRSNGWIEGDRGHLRITDAGLQALGSYEPLPAGRELLQYWLNELGDSGASRLLQAIADAYPNALTKEEAGAAAGLSSGSGTFGTYLSRLRTLELVEGKSHLRASDELFS